MPTPSTEIVGERLTRRRSRAALLDLALVGVALTWGSSYVAMKIVGESLEVHQFLFFRFALAFVVLGIAFHREVKRLTNAELRLGSLFGVLLFAILSLEVVGVQHTSASNAGFLIALSVILVPMMERVFGGMQKGATVYICCAAAIVGCGLLTYRSGNHFSLALGDYIIIGAAFIRGFQIYLFGRLSRGEKLSEINATIVSLGVVTLMSALFWGSAAASGHASVAPMQISVATWLIILYLAVFGTAFAFLVQLQAARYVSSTNVAIILATEPLFSAFFAWFILDESLSILQLTGGVVIVGAVTLGRLAERARLSAEVEPFP